MIWKRVDVKNPEAVNFKYNGVDRIDNAIGYTKENCVPCCAICNNSKSTLSLKDWLEWIERISTFQIKTFNDYPVREYIQVSGNGEHPNRMKI